jgi:putative membrane protein
MIYSNKIRGVVTIAMFGYGGMMGNYGYGMGYGGMFFGLLFWILIIVVAYLLIKNLINQSKTHSDEGKSALDHAKERYAKGEITKEELEEIKKNLI